MFKKLKTNKWTAILVALVLVTSLFVGGTIARYVTSTSSEDEARVAVWGINEVGTTMDLFENQYKLEDGTLVAKSADETEDIIAPGLNGVSQFKIVNTSTLKPEVMYEIAISLDDSEIADEIKNHPGIEWKVDNGEWGTWEEFKTELLSLSGDPSGVKTYAPLDVNHEFANGKTHTVAWQWIMDSGYDAEDTAMGNYAAETGDITAKLSITVTARQTDVDSTGMLEGNGSVFNTNDPQVLTFRADADYSTFSNVEVDGTEVNPSNYETAPGSIKVKLKKEYLETLSLGEHIITINTTDDKSIESKFTITDSMTIVHNGIIPEGAIYYVQATREYGSTKLKEYVSPVATYTEGQPFPQTVKDGDVYIYEGYEYRYNTEYLAPMDEWYILENNGWTVRVIDSSKTNYPKLLTTINNKNLVNMQHAFTFCDKMETAPVIPNSVKNLSSTFLFCSNLTSAPIIPENVSNISSIFEECTNLTGTVIINAKALNGIGCAFARTSKPIILTGTSSKLNEIAATAIDYDSNPIGNVTVAQ